MSYLITFSMTSGGSRRVIVTAKQVVSSHIDLVLAGANSIVIRNAENVIVTLASVTALALSQA